MGDVQLYNSEGKTLALQKEKFLSPPFCSVHILCVWTDGRDVSLRPPGLRVRQNQSAKEVCQPEKVCVAHPCYSIFGQLCSSMSQSKLSRCSNCHLFRGSDALTQWKADGHGVLRLSPSTHIKKQYLLSTLKQFWAPVL